uniref:Uncharacterized protein n=1 Tax=Lactuca sativa TaxID=4236 RepID=A0A9R1VGK6_LACSA|nr:hypothetical protein LSAT_V11C500255550 [Lactuca sativa]
MVERNITLIKDFDNMKDDYTLKVSIIRLSRSMSDVNPTIGKSMEMILMDEMCTKIRASVYPRDFQRFESKLKEDQVVFFRSPTITPNRYSFKISDVKEKLNLHGRTTMKECLHFQSKSTYKFSCVSFERIISATTTSNDTVPSYATFPTFGCRVFPYLRDYTRHKLSPRSASYIFIGYSPKYRGYHCLDPSTNRVYVTRHAQFDEDVFPFSGIIPPVDDGKLLFSNFDDFFIQKLLTTRSYSSTHFTNL